MVKPDLLTQNHQCVRESRNQKNNNNKDLGYTTGG